MTKTNIVITGAAGRIGRALRAGLRRDDRRLRLLDKADMAPAASNEEVIQADLGDLTQLSAAMQGMDMLIHLAAIPDEYPWEDIFPTNYLLTYNAFEAARQAGIKRILFASSIQAVGFHPIANVLNNIARPRPSGFYGLSKVFGEGLGSLLADRHGISFFALRIASFEDKPGDTRMLKTWLSPRDAVHLFDRCIDAPPQHFAIVYGISANQHAMVDNSHASWLGYAPQDNAEIFRGEIETAGNPIGENAKLTHGGGATDVGFTDTTRRFLQN